jgi:hypothetical protein
MSTLNLIVFCIVGLLSTGCGDNPDWDRVTKERHDASVVRISEKLPSGCTITDLGVYETMRRDHIPLVVVDCKNTTTANELQRVGKNSHTTVVVKQK